MEKDIQAIIDYSHSFAEKMLLEFKEYYPFGVQIENNGELTPIGYEDEESDMPFSQKVIDELLNYFNKALEENKIRAYGLTYDVKIKIDDASNKSDAILINIIHRDSYEIPIYYWTYSWSEDNELIFGESFGMKRE